MTIASSSAADKRPMTIDDLFKFKRVADPQISPDGKWVVYVITTVTDVATNKTQANLWLASTDGKTNRQLTTTDKKDRHPRWSPDGRQILFESSRSGDSQLWVIDLHGGEARQLTKISTEANTAIWSRDGKRIAFVSAVYPENSEKPFKESNELNKKKKEEIEKNPVKAKVFKQLFYRHWDSWVEDKRQHLFVMNADGGDPHDATPGDRDAYPTSTTFSIGDDYTFSPDGNYLVFTAVPAHGEAWSTNHDICRVSVTNTSPKWETLTANQAGDTAPLFSPDGTKMAYRSQKKVGYEADKWNLTVVDCNPDGTLKGEPKAVTEKLDRSVDQFVWLPDNDTILFLAEENGGTPIWEVRTSTSESSQLTNGGTLGSISVSKDGNKMVFTHAAIHQPPRVGTMGTARGSSETLHFIDPNADLLAQLELPKAESVELPVEGGNKMQIWILKPPGFDASKKWPVAYLVHGGPQGAWDDGWSFRWCPEIWAAQGYVVALPNPARLDRLRPEIHR